jgi:hypothetical protein
MGSACCIEDSPGSLASTIVAMASFMTIPVATPVG